ncbi:MAG: alpha/beta fold hydrolase [Patescibacteria group bacterium]
MRKVTVVLIALIFIVGFNILINTINKKPMTNPIPTPTVEKVSFITADGVTIVGNYYNSTSTKAVLLLHQNGMDKSSWGDFPLVLQARGFAVLAIDLRGYGESTQISASSSTATGSPGTLDYRNFTNKDYFPAMMGDITAARKFLQSKGKTEQDIVGASIGANLAIVELALHTEPRDPRSLIGYKPLHNEEETSTPFDPVVRNGVAPSERGVSPTPFSTTGFDPTKIDPLGRIKRIVALSPGLDFKGIQTALPAHNIKTEYEQEKTDKNINALYRFGPLPVALLVSAPGDDYSYQSVKKLEEIITEPLALTLTMDGNAHGVNILTDKPQAREAIINFLAR